MTSHRDDYEAQNAAQSVSEQDPFTIERYRQFSAYLPPSTTTVLDVGCNTGRGGACLAKLHSGLVLYGLDCVQERLERLPPCYTHRIHGQSTDVPLADRTLDAVVAGEFLEHLYPADVDASICEFQRVLAVGGRLLLTTPNPRYLLNRLRHATIYSTSHLTQHYPEILRWRLRMHGFSRIRLLGSGKASRYLGQHVPLLALYGSYMLVATKE